MPGSADWTRWRRSSKASRRRRAVCGRPNGSRHLIKRIVAIEGDRVAVRGGHAVVNGMVVQEPYVRTLAEGALAHMREIRVPAGTSRS